MFCFRGLLVLGVLGMAIAFGGFVLNWLVVAWGCLRCGVSALCGLVAVPVGLLFIACTGCLLRRFGFYVVFVVCDLVISCWVVYCW